MLTALKILPCAVSLSSASQNTQKKTSFQSTQLKPSNKKGVFIAAHGTSSNSSIMKNQTIHNIICLEAEWEYSERNRKNRFSLNTLPMLNWLKEAYDCEIIYRRIRTKSDLKYYLDYFRTHEEEEFEKFDIIYFACHGEKKSLWIEGQTIPLTTISKWAKGFFEDKILHFSSCRTMSNKIDSKHFKRDCLAKMVSGYQISVDAYDSGIADIALLNDLLSQKDIDIERYTDCESEFYTRYESLLSDLHFHAC